MVFSRQEDVEGLDVAVNDAGMVQARQTCEHLKSVGCGPLDGQAARWPLGAIGLPDRLPEVVAVVVHDIVGPFGVFVRIQNGNDVGVVDAGHASDFFDEKGPQAVETQHAREGLGRLEAFEGEGTPDNGVGDFVHPAHAAPA